MIYLKSFDNFIHTWALHWFTWSIILKNHYICKRIKNIRQVFEEKSNRIFIASLTRLSRSTSYLVLHRDFSTSLTFEARAIFLFEINSKNIGIYYRRASKDWKPLQLSFEIKIDGTGEFQSLKKIKKNQAKIDYCEVGLKSSCQEEILKNCLKNQSKMKKT